MSRAPLNMLVRAGQRRRVAPPVRIIATQTCPRIKKMYARYFFTASVTPAISPRPLLASDINAGTETPHLLSGGMDWVEQAVRAVSLREMLALLTEAVTVLDEGCLTV